MPICPRCSATIHPGAEDQCPACGYSLARANAIFGEGQVEFTRVLDGAGALTHQERIELLHTLEDLERLVPPAALCIYITDNGQVQDMRTHAHWILNHARIHHPSFGKREQRKAIEDAELRERRPGEERPHYADVSPGLLERLKNSIVTYVRDAMHPTPPPVRQEWMLMLVVDVQLEMACFTWGYKLDPYINADSINSCIISARLQFRERAMVSGLKKVMKAAVQRLAIDAHRVNRRLRRNLPLRGMHALLPVLFALGALVPAAEAAPARNAKTPAKPATKTTTKPAIKSTAKPAAKTPAKSTAKPTAKPTPKPVVKPAAKPAPAPAPKTPAAPVPELEDDDVAEEVEETTPAETVSPAAAEPAVIAETPAAAPAETVAPPPAEAPAPVADSGASASYSAAPRWQTEHYRLLMLGELETGYNALFPAEGTTPAAKPSPTEKNDESDTQIPGRYCDSYLHPEASVTLCDPQKLLSTPETNDVAHTLRTLNADARYRLCVAVFRGSQEIPAEMHASALVGAVARPVSEYAALLVYPIGAPEKIDIGYREIKPDDKLRHEWLTAVREAAVNAGGGAEGLMAALRTLNAFIAPLSVDFRPINPDTTEKTPLIDIELKPKEEKKPSMKERMRKALENPENIPLVIAGGSVLSVLAAVFGWFFFIRRHSAHLLDSPADLRLASPYGAGVSRQVRYLEGRESDKEQTLF